MEVEDDIQLADIAEVLVEVFHEQVDQLQVQQLIIVDVDAHCEVQALVPLVDYLEVVELSSRGRYLDEVGLLGVTPHDHPVDLRLQAHFLVLVVVYEPLRQAGAPSTVLQQDESDLNSSMRTIGLD